MGRIIDETRKKLIEDITLKENPVNFLQALIAACDSEGSISNEMIIGNVLTMLLAGEDTTSHTLTWIFYFMHVYPEVQQKMQQEADTVLNRGIHPFKRDLSGCRIQKSEPDRICLTGRLRLFMPVRLMLIHDAFHKVSKTCEVLKTSQVYARRLIALT